MVGDVAPLVQAGPDLEASHEVYSPLEPLITQWFGDFEISLVGMLTSTSLVHSSSVEKFRHVCRGPSPNSPGVNRVIEDAFFPLRQSLLQAHGTEILTV